VGEKALLLVNGDGAITLPDAARRALQLEPGTQVECEVVDSTIILRKAEELPVEDAWLYQPESVARLTQAAQRARSGRRWRVTETFLQDLAAMAEAAHTAGQDLSPEALAAALAAAERSGEVERVESDSSPSASR